MFESSFLGVKSYYYWTILFFVNKVGKGIKQISKNLIATYELKNFVNHVIASRNISPYATANIMLCNLWFNI